MRDPATSNAPSGRVFEAGPKGDIVTAKRTSWRGWLKLALGAAVVIAATAAAQARSQLLAAPNDAFATPQALTSGPMLKPGTIIYASRELGEPRVYPDGGMRRTVWYRYAASSTGRAVLMITGGFTRPAPFQVAIYTGSRLATLSRVARVRAKASAEDPAAAVSFPTTAGRIYLVQVDGVVDERTFYGDFLIGLQQVGERGGLAMFRTRPLFVEEDACCDSDRISYVANGFPVAVKLAADLGSLTGKLALTSTEDVLAAGQVSKVTLADADPNFAAGTVTTGRLTVVAGRGPAGDVLGRASAPVTVITPEYERHPVVDVYHLDTNFRVRVNARASTRTKIRNTSDVDAVGCRFEPDKQSDWSAYDLQAHEILPGGKTGAGNPVFDLKAGETKNFAVSYRPLYWDIAHIFLYCANKDMKVKNTVNDTFRAWADLGIPAFVELRPDADTEFGELRMGKFETRLVHVDVTNRGEYSGDFKMEIQDDRYHDRAVVTGLCVAEGVGDCKLTSARTYLIFDLAVGETRRVTAAVRHGGGAGGEIVVRMAVKDDSPTGLSTMGMTGIQVVPK
ncbi:hypothetical protein OHA_1_00022 [Pleomorphomonas sp. SM30]|uniref:Uncharacterized protein n=1 Tax=Oharaeibacter diazotrophicus TaxID=1920512 RepID=A0A4R6RP34_9HYPH|nr:hypothetical protein [Oharaeibacter diazotrophicus]TDP87596.1 hypothetical protein EDD54_1495 [Oharaeibacter diazotrophicus]BBE70460.1 hypothetical protein OHA_1_00022 [Pleomorphomonas sp. SM30]